MKKLLLSVLILFCLCACGEPDISVSAEPEPSPEPTFDLAEYENPVKLAKTAKLNDDFIYDVYVDHVSISSYRGNSDTMEIPAEIDGIPVTVLSGIYQTGITSVTLPEGLLAIKEPAFWNCAALTEVQLPASLKHLELGAFSGCPALETLSIPAGVESIDLFGYMEGERPALRVAADNPYFTTVDGILFDKAMETLLYFPSDWAGAYSVPESVKSIEAEAFSGSTLTQVTLPEGLRELGDCAIFHCDNLTSITLPKSLDSLGYGALQENAGLTEVRISPENPHYVSLDGVLYTKDLTELLAYPPAKPDRDYALPEELKTGWYLPLFNPYLETLHAPAGIEGHLFGYLTSSKEIYYAGTPKDWLCLFHWVSDSMPAPTVHFLEDTATADDWIREGSYAYTLSQGEAVLRGYAGQETFISVPETLGGCPVTEIAPRAFSFLGTVEEITLPEGIQTVGEQAFYGTPLSKVTIPSTVENIGPEAFAFCGNLSEIAVTSGNRYYTSEDGVLYTADMTTLLRVPPRAVPEPAPSAEITYRSSYILPAGVTAIAEDAFLGCTGLGAIGVAAGNTAFSSADGVLITADGTTLIAYPAGPSNRSVPDSVTKTAPWSMAYTPAFFRISTLQRITELGRATFAWAQLQSITIPPGITRIPADAFLGSFLREIVLPASVTEIGEDAFLRCNSLETVRYAGTAEDWANIAIAPGNETLETAVIHFERTDQSH